MRAGGTWISYVDMQVKMQKKDYKTGYYRILTAVSCKLIHTRPHDPHFKEEKERGNGNDKCTHDEGITKNRKKIGIPHFLNDYPCQRSDKGYNRSLHFLSHPLRTDGRFLLKIFDIPVKNVIRMNRAPVTSTPSYECA